MVDDVPRGAAGERADGVAVLSRMAVSPMVRFTPLVALLFATAAFASQPHISFVRTIPAPHDLAPADSAAFIYALGDSEKVTDFVEDFVEIVSRGGTLSIEDDVERNAHLAVSDPAAFARLRRDHPASVYIGLNRFSCAGEDKQAEGSEHDVNGARVKVMHAWVDVVCTGRIDVLRGKDGKKIVSFTVRGEGSSPRSADLTDDERDVAYDNAAHQAAVVAADEITPRKVRETIELDESAAEFDSGYAMINSDRLDDARAIWQEALKRHRDDAALHFDLGALCEAMGDVDAARAYFGRAVKLSPKRARYVSEFELFRRRH